MRASPSPGCADFQAARGDAEGWRGRHQPRQAAAIWRLAARSSTTRTEAPVAGEGAGERVRASARPGSGGGRQVCVRRWMLRMLLLTRDW